MELLFAIAFLIIVFIAYLLIQYWWVFLIIGVVIFLFVILPIMIWKLRSVNKPQKQYELYYQDISRIDSMDGFTFERFVGDLLKRKCYKNVCVTKGSGDFGVDVIAELDGHNWAFQCKNYASNLGVKPIQEVYSGAAKYGATKSVVVTNSYFTAHAQELAKSLGVILWDRDKLIELIVETNPNKKEIPITIEQELVSESEVIEKQNNSFDLCIANDEFVFTPSSSARNEEYITSSEKEIPKFEGSGTLLRAGKYVFGEDIPLGKYNLKVISGKGTLVIQRSKEKDDEDFIWMGMENDVAHSYYGLSLKQGLSFTLDGNLIVEISKSKMLEIN